MVSRVSANTKIKQNELDAKIRFGFGLNSRASSDEIDAREAAHGVNWTLDARNSQLRPRGPFDLVGTAPNGQSVDGYGQLVKADGTISTLIQAGTAVYETDFTDWTQVGSVSAGVNLRGPLSHNWTLDDILILTDLSLTDPVKTWNGTTFANMTENLTGIFKARYCFVARDRAFFANVESNSTVTPHLLVASAVEDYTDLSVSDKPSSALGEGDPFYLTMPDLKPINGLVEAFGVFVMSTTRGRIFQLTGSTSKDYAIAGLYLDSAADGAEAIAFVGNDIFYGRQGRIESLRSTDQFGDVETDDLSQAVSNLVEGYEGWTIAYNPRLQKVYFHGEGQNDLLVLHKPLIESGFSPWTRWTTQHSSNFSVTALMTLYDPVDGLLYTYFGDAGGNIYRLDGSGTDGDAGSAAIAVSYTTRLFSANLDAQAYNLSGWIKYRSLEAATVTLTFLWQGRAAFNESVTIAIPAPSDGTYYSGDFYFGGDNYFGSAFSGKLLRQIFDAPGQAEDLQVQIDIEGTTSFEINEIGIRLEEASR
jgi:hypothetical protein